MNKKNTKDKIIDSAIELFSKKWFETVSVAEICRNAGVSNGVIYRYFKNKKVIFEYLLNLLLEYIEEITSTLQGNTSSEKLQDFSEKLFKIAIEKKSLVTIFREGQFRFPEYEEKLRNIYMKTLSDIFNKKISEVEYLYLLSPMRFVNIRYAYNALKTPIDNLKKYLLNGFFDYKLNDLEKLFSKPKFIKYKKDNKTKSKLLDSGIKLFGENGYFNVGIYDITKEAGFSVGTFYLLFDSKDEFLEEIVKIIGKKARDFLNTNQIDSLNPLEKIIRNIYNFILFFKKYHNYYLILREAEFVVNKEVVEYYNFYEKMYKKLFESFNYKDNILLANIFVGYNHYIGIESIFSKNIPSIKIFLKQFSKYLSNGIKHI
ncbi:TetR family transcriptional regulator [Tepiditoga spiralis]|uniref:TetR family transcriptional regulator n=1 Tax=Tepiditoga spiralis TaxID=2108365 RepID=A0A7G1G4S2_9BACT|nr:TetR/AcrR family transcriptional regulator [Tepiditoga spiralis]BBE31538.1 TetR family transcriptional regulator [Tepiditoga spiralis]